MLRKEGKAGQQEGREGEKGREEVGGMGREGEESAPLSPGPSDGTEGEQVCPAEEGMFITGSGWA